MARDNRGAVIVGDDDDRIAEPDTSAMKGTGNPLGCLRQLGIGGGSTAVHDRDAAAPRGQHAALTRDHALPVAPAAVGLSRLCPNRPRQLQCHRNIFAATWSTPPFSDIWLNSKSD